MLDRCPVCNEYFVRETGFYWGAIVSHASLDTISSG